MTFASYMTYDVYTTYTHVTIHTHTHTHVHHASYVCRCRAGKETKDAERAHGADGESREEAGKEAPAFAKVQAER